MERCEQCRNQMLEHLYDLLEGPEQQAFLEHLGQCAACQGALNQARAQQQLLSAAAKKQFPEVQFQPPPRVAAPQPAAPVVLSMPRRSGRSVVRWAVAAAALLVAVGLGVPGAYVGNDYLSARNSVNHHEAVIAHSKVQLGNTLAHYHRLDQVELQKMAEVDEQVRDQRLKVEVSGPESVQSGGHNEYRITAKNLNDKIVPARVDVRIHDQAAPDRVVFEEKEVAFKGEHRLVLPRNLAVAPNTMLTMTVSARRDGGPQSEVHQELSLARALYLTHLTTDKPMYQPGEIVRFRSLTLERFSLKPAEEPLQLIYTVRFPGVGGNEAHAGSGNTSFIQDMNGAQLLGPDNKPIRGVGAGEFPLDFGAPGGEYTLIVRDVANRFQPQERKFIVNRYQPPQLNKELDYGRKSYGAGEEVVAVVKATRAGNGDPAVCRVTATVQIDGKTYGAEGKESSEPIAFKTDNQGKLEVRFKLPAEIEKGEASLSLKFQDGANIEPLTRPIPIVLKKLDVEFFPEGGDLVAGVPNRVYFQARSTLGKPADVRGRIVDQDGNVIAQSVETLNDKDHPGVNQGMGLFALKPEVGKKYELKIDAPAGVEGRYFLPEVKKDGVVLSIPEGVFRADEPIRATVHNAGQERALLVGGYCRGRMLDHQRITVKKDGASDIVLKPTLSVGGVYRVTVFEELPGPGNQREFAPRAERLVYRKPLQRLEMALHPDKKQYVPGDKVKVNVTGVTEDDVPAPAILMVRVVDKSVLTLADEKTHRAMPTHFYMTTEVRKPDDLEYADFLVTAHPRAKEALDLLLGTQGWRRFAEQNPEEFQKKFKDEAERLLVTIGQNPPDAPRVMEGQAGPETLAFERKAREKVIEEMKKEEDSLIAQLGKERGELAEAKNDPNYLAAVGTLERFAKWGNFARKVGVPLLALTLLLAAVVCFLVALARGVPRSALQVGISAVCFLLFCSLVVIEVTGGQSNRTFSTVGNRIGSAPAAAEGDDVAGIWKERQRDARLNNANAENLAEDARMDPKTGGDRAGQNRAIPRPDATGAVPTGAGFDKFAAEQLAKKFDEKRPADPREKGEGKAKTGNKDDKNADGIRNLRKEALDMDRAPEREKDVDPGRRQPPMKPQPRGEAPFGGRGPAPAFFVRQFAYTHKPAKGGERSEFAETVYWHPVLVLPNGKTEVQFDLSDSVTTFEVTAYGHTLDGRLGAVSTNIHSQLPFTLEPKVPIEVTANDKIDIPVSISNNTPEKREVNFKVEHTGLKLLGGKVQDQLTLRADERTRRVFRFQPSLIEGSAKVIFEGKTEPFAADKISRGFVVVPEGFPVAGARSDMLEGVASNDLVLPETWVAGTLKVQVQVYPSTLSALQKGLESLLREPHGCFEQTSTSNYPNLLILDYLKENDLANPEVDRRARDLLGKGYQKLTSFECRNTTKNSKEGYEWFGGTAPAHEALTAYGLLQFRDMARVHDVDPAMVERTRQYLMSQRDGNGGFKRNPRALDTFGRAPDHITNAYIVWALTESGKDDNLEKELAVLTEQAKTSKDPYFVSLVAVSLLNRDKGDTAVALLKEVAKAQKPDGHLDAEKTSITGSGGQSLQIETTAFAVLGWLKANRPADFNIPVQNAIKWMGQQRGNTGGFGSTQSTILALKSLIAYTKANKRPAEPGELKLFVGEQEATKLAFGTDSQDALILDLKDAEKHLKPGKNPLRVEITGKNVFPYTLAWSYQTLKPASADGCPVRLNTRLSKTTADEGDSVRLTVALENISGKGQGMAMAIVGLPAGCNVPENLKQLKDHCLLREGGTKSGLISAFEIRGRELVLYWRDLAPDQKIEVPIDLDCRIPGEFRGPASRAYLYYNPDTKHWVDPLQVTIQAKTE